MSTFACRWRAARTVSSRWARCIGLRVWKATIFLHASFLKCARNSDGVSIQKFTQLLGSLCANSRRTAQGNIVKVGGQLDCLYFSADVVVVHMIVKVCNSGMGTVVCSKDLFCLIELVWPVNILNYRLSI